MFTNYNKHNIKLIRIFWLLFIVFIIYSTLIPFNLTANMGSLNSNISKINKIPFFDSDGSRASIPDIVQNIFLFIPFGFFGILSMKYKNKLILIIKITLLASLLSGFVEVIQLFTRDRTTSVTDLLTNSSGAFIGAVSASLIADVYSKLIKISKFKQFISDKYFFLTLMAFILSAIGALQPFDLTLDVGIVGSKIKTLIINPIKFNAMLSDEGIVFIRLFLFCFSCSIWLKSLRVHYYYAIAFLIISTSGIFFETFQIFVRSRMPNIQDVLVMIMASFLGMLFSLLNLKNLPRTLWTTIIIIGVGISAGMNTLSPFQFKTNPSSFNWVPFLAYYERTTFIALANFIESVLIYLPLGFLLSYFYSREHRIQSFIFIILVGAIISSSLEIFQVFVPGRYADITDIIGAIGGSVIGAMACWEWKEFFNVHHIFSYRN